MSDFGLKFQVEPKMLYNNSTAYQCFITSYIFLFPLPTNIPKCSIHENFQGFYFCLSVTDDNTMIVQIQSSFSFENILSEATADGRLSKGSGY